MLKDAALESTLVRVVLQEELNLLDLEYTMLLESASILNPSLTRSAMKSQVSQEKALLFKVSEMLVIGPQSSLSKMEEK